MLWQTYVISYVSILNNAKFKLNFVCIHVILNLGEFDNNQNNFFVFTFKILNDKPISYFRPDRKLWVPTKNSRICSAHFVGGERSNNPKKESYHPTLFPTNKKTKFPVSTGVERLEVPGVKIEEIDFDPLLIKSEAGNSEAYMVLQILNRTKNDNSSYLTRIIDAKNAFHSRFRLSFRQHSRKVRNWNSNRSRL